ncbi:hypothetical protein RDE2_04570 [Rhodococcus sp. RDE2]|nr:hypothetical protein RDE2_04570 [Rhodococcus sp. RDE2]
MDESRSALVAGGDVETAEHLETLADREFHREAVGLVVTTTEAFVPVLRYRCTRAGMIFRQFGNDEVVGQSPGAAHKQVM